MIGALALTLGLQAQSPDDTFQRGDFAAAGRAYRAAAAANPKDAAAFAGIARVELYANHLSAAQAAARSALALDPANAAALRVTQVVAQRSALLAQSAHVKVPAAGAVIPFIATDPLPLMQITINGHKANVMLDTGAPDITIDPDFARENGIAVHDTGDVGTFAGGKQAAMLQAQLREVSAGGISLQHLNATVLPSRMLDFFPGRKVDAVMGTAFLSRFLATIDYPRARLILAPRSSHPRIARNAAIMPMWFVGDHFIITDGTLNADAHVPMLIDSGLAGGGFSPNNDVIESAHVKTFPDRAAQGVGGGGAVTFVPATADTLCLGTVCRNNVEGSYTPSGTPLGIFPFHVEAIVSHTFLKQYAVTLDFERMQFILAP